MIVLADAGGTKTDWAVLTDNHVEYKRSNGYNPLHSHEKIQIPPYLYEIGERVDQVFYYGTGCAGQGPANIMNGLLHEYFKQAKIRVYSDLMLPAHVGFSKGPGLIGVLGTGSSMAYYVGSELFLPVPSPGIHKGDPGSGTAIGLKLLHDFHEGFMPKGTRDEFLFFLESNEIIRQSDYARFIVNTNSAYVLDLCYQEVEKYFHYYKDTIRLSENNEIAFAGSIASVLHNLVKEIAEKNGLMLRKIVDKPIVELVEFYSSMSSRI